MKSVVICGSRRFTEQIRAFANELKDKGIVVYEPYLHSGGEEWSHMSDYYKNFVLLGLTHDHFYKIRLADIVYIYNQNDYIGTSTTLELGFAVALGKPIYSYSLNDPDRARRVLLKQSATTPDELISKLI